MELVGNNIANMYWEHKILYHQKEKIFLENDKKGYIMNKYDLKLYAKEESISPVDYIMSKHYNTTSQCLQNMYSPDKKQPKVNNESNLNS